MICSHVEEQNQMIIIHLKFWFTFTLTNLGICGNICFPHLANTQNVEGGRVEGFYVEFLRSERLDDDSLTGSCKIGHREVPGTKMRLFGILRCDILLITNNAFTNI